MAAISQGISIDSDLLSSAKSRAAMQGRTLSNYVVLLIRQDLAKVKAAQDTKPENGGGENEQG